MAELAEHVEHPVGRRVARDDGRCESAQPQPGGASRRDELIEQRRVVAADVGRRRTDPDASVPACDVVDEIAEWLRDRGSRVPREQLVDLRGGASRVERPADRGVAEPVDRRVPGRLDVGEEADVASELARERSGRDRRHVGLDEDVIDRVRGK